MLAERAGAPRMLILLALLTIAALALVVHHHRAHRARHVCGCQIHERFVVISAPLEPVTQIVIWQR